MEPTRAASKPVVFLDVDGFYAPLFALFDEWVAARFVRPAHRSLAQPAITVAAATTLATSPAPATPHKWIDL